jgi:hypothetical protein
MANFLTGSPGRVKQVSTFTPQQQGLQNQGIQQLMQLLQSGYGSKPDISGYQPFAQEARRQYNEVTLPSIAERFAGMGSNAGSSAFNSAVGRAGANLDRQLQMDAAQFGQQQQGLQQQLLQLLTGLGTQRGFENIYQQGQPGALQPLLGGIGKGLGGYLGSGGNPLAGLMGLLSGFGGGQ